MRLLSSTDFALRVLMYLAEDPSRLVNTEQLAKDLNISRNHLQKVVQSLVSGEFAHTLRGAKGGVRLTQAPNKICVGAVVRWFEGKQALVECFNADGGQCTLKSKCGLRKVLTGAQETFFRELDQVTIADCLKTCIFTKS